ncbi:MFS transporter [Okeania hirsuta]|uniref:MFS transporter n=1 Tax=Okeania hirsuta TaxID=1458930 RepID=A0A3N6QJ24_9CYAN|nr:MULTISPECIES: MFS transporter [Okeania]NET78960.1 MFS transporter [Okeania sp. SIO1F9]RQH42266.1 MFS transporter [Okeania hirsuta]
MKKKQMLALGLHRFAVAMVARGLSPLLPVYAIYLDANSQLVGYYMSFLQIALITGNFLGGWLGDKLGNKKVLLIASTVVSIPTIWLIGQVNNIWQLATLTAIVWCFYLGIGINLNITLVGLLSNPEERGKVFGIFSVVAALAGLLTGLTFGPIADMWGYSTMFKFVCLFSCIFALSELFLEDKPISNTHLPEKINEQSTKKWSKEFLLMLIATLIMGLVSFGGNLGISLAMNQQGFLLRHISFVMGFSASISFLFSPLSGWMSDKFGHKPILISCYLIGALGIFSLASAVSLWQFYLAACGISFLSYVALGPSSALITDLVAPDFLGRGISLFRTALRAGGILGFTFTGSLIEKMGISLIFALEGLILIFAVGLLIPQQYWRQKF